MKTSFLLLLVLSLLKMNNAYTQNSVGNIVFSLVMPSEIQGFDENQLIKLESKIIQATTTIGIAGKGFYSDFILYPTVIVNDIENHAQSMKNTVSYSIDLGLYVKSISDGRIYSSFSKTLIGIGPNQRSALNNALNDINPLDKEFSIFFTQTSEKIISYFEAKCEAIISKADDLAKMGKYDEALALLMSIPNVSANCYKEVKRKSIEVYKLYLNKTCQTQLLLANGLYTNRNINEAIKTICKIDPTTDCFQDAKTFLTKIENDLNAKEKEEYNQSLKLYQDELELEKLKLAAIKEIAIAYYTKQPTNYNYYDVIIK